MNPIRSTANRSPVSARRRRCINSSSTYQLSTRPNPTNAGDTRNFAKATIRRIRAEVLLDCISQVTEAKEKFRGLPLGARAVQIGTANFRRPHIMVEIVRDLGKRCVDEGKSLRELWETA